MAENNPTAGTGAEPGETLTRKQTVIALRESIRDEYKAASDYEARAAVTPDPRARDVLLSIAAEEKVHAGEFQAVLAQLAPDEASAWIDGALEVIENQPAAQDMIAKAREVTEMGYQVTFGGAVLAIAKAADTSGDWPFRGVLSSTRPDAQGDAFTRGCLEYMADAINSKRINVTDKTHVDPGVRDTMGYVHKAELLKCDDGEWELLVSGALFGTDPFTPRVARQIEDGQVTMSVDGKIPSAQYVYKANHNGGKVARFVERIDPKNALFCNGGREINHDTWVLPIAKALEDGDALEIAKAAEVSDAKWDGKRSDLPKSAYLVQSDKWAECKLPVYEPDETSTKDAAGHYTRRGALNADAVRAALADVGGAHTGTPMDIPADVRAKLDALAEQAGIKVAKAMENEEAVVETPEMEPIPVEVVETEAPPSPVFAENSEAEDGEEAFEEIADEFEDLVEQLQKTVVGILAQPANERAGLIMAALKAFTDAFTAQFSEDIAKAGARHSAADMNGLHKIIDTAKSVCGCPDCAGTVAKAEEPESDTASEPTAAEAPAVEPEPIPVAKAEDDAPPPAAEPLDIAKAVEDAIAPFKTLLDETTGKLKEVSDELAILKAMPADGGPEVPELTVAKAEDVDATAVRVSLSENGVLRMGRIK
jgi:hypothetical protein